MEPGRPGGRQVDTLLHGGTGRETVMSSGPLIRWLTPGKDCSLHVSDQCFPIRYPSSLLRRLQINISSWCGHKYEEQEFRKSAGAWRNWSTWVCMTVHKWDLPCVHRQMFLHVSASFDAKSETRPEQNAGSESQRWEGRRDRVIGMRVFTVNKNKGWQAGWLLHRNAHCPHHHPLFVSFGYPPLQTPTLQRIVTLTCVNYLLCVCTWNEADHNCVRVCV